MITMYGMSDKFGLMSLETVESQYLSGRSQLNCSDATAGEIDEEVRKYLGGCYEEAKQILSQHMTALDKLADYLIQRETITGREFMKIYREVEGLPQEPPKSQAEQFAEEVRREERRSLETPQRYTEPGMPPLSDKPQSGAGTAPQAPAGTSGNGSTGAGQQPVGTGTPYSAQQPQPAGTGTPSSAQQTGADGTASPAGQGHAGDAEAEDKSSPRGRFSGAREDDLGRKQ